MNNINVENCDELDYIKDDKYRWFYAVAPNLGLSFERFKKSNNDKIGISPDGKILMKDNMMYSLKKYKKLEKNGINNTKKIILIYCFDRQYNFRMHEKQNLISFYYFGKNEKMVFSHIIYEGKEYLMD